MKSICTNLLALSLTLPLLACGGIDENPDQEGADAGPTVEDTTAPSLVSTTPLDGAIGQLATTDIVLRFSERMNRDSVESALDLGTIGAASMTWNSAGDTLTIRPDQPLTYAKGAGDPEELPAIEYEIGVDESAMDLAGNGLGMQSRVAFSTLKSLSIDFSPDQLMSRVVTPNGFMYESDDPFVVGDVITPSAENGMRSVLTFDIGSIPATAHSIHEALLSTRQEIGEIAGVPFPDLGSSVLLDHVTYLGIAGANAAFNSSEQAHSTVGTMFVQDQLMIEVDVTSPLNDDLTNRSERADQSQFLARFEKISDLGGDTDRAVFSRDLLTLSVSYLHP